MEGKSSTLIVLLVDVRRRILPNAYHFGMEISTDVICFPIRKFP